MTDKKLTDSAVIETFEKIIDILRKTEVVVLQKEPIDDLIFHIQRALDLINRQKEEIERLENAYKQVAWERDIFAEDMKQEIKKDCSYLMLDIKTIKAEAYKRFWNSRPERLNEQCEGKEEYNKGWNACLDEFWDIRNNLFEELVGEDNGEEKE